jgi:YrbI family 3-deoxy-D-manno-octulosonate 8-phosphate phosphatase
MDVDGTLTNGRVYYSANGEELKKFSIRDGMGIELLKLADIDLAIITSENSNIVKARASKLNIKNLILGSRNKKKSLIELIDSLSLTLEETAYIGDDVNDLPALEIAGFSACPLDATDTVKDKCDFISTKQGGKGAIREFAELIILYQNKSITLPENW